MASQHISLSSMSSGSHSLFPVAAGPYIGHMAESYGGSSGSPMLREYKNGLIVVGLHRGDLSNKGHTYINVATLITFILDDIQMVDYDDSESKGHTLVLLSVLR